MPSQDYLPTNENALATWLENFYTVCQDHAAELSLTPTELEVIGDGKDGYRTSLNAQESAVAAAKAATNFKNGQRRSITQIVRTYAKEFKANPAVSPSTLVELGIISNAVAGPVVTVTGLTIVGCDDGNNKLTWNRNGNSAQTIFIVEYRMQGSTQWNFAAGVTKTSFIHEDQTPGEMMWYRITATRAGQTSSPCPQVAVYANSGGNGLEIAA